MTRIETKSDWGWWDTLDGVPLKTGDRLHVRWPNGAVTVELVTVDRSTVPIQDMGHEYLASKGRAFTVVRHHGLDLRAYLAGLEAERVGPEVPLGVEVP